MLKSQNYILRKLRNVQRALGMEVRWPDLQQCGGWLGRGQTGGRETSQGVNAVL